MSQSEILTPLLNELRELTKQVEQPQAVFDADGTLWSIDMGEACLQHLTQRPGYQHVFQHYLSMRWGGQKKEALIYAAQVVQGLTIETVRSFCEDHFQQNLSHTVFDPIRDFLKELRKGGFQLFVVSASPRWAVLPGALSLGFEDEHVFALETAIEHGRYTNQLATLFTSGPGKAEVLKQHGIQNIWLAAGNTGDDIHLLEQSKGLKLCVYSAVPETALGASETLLQEHARRQGPSWRSCQLQVNKRPT